ncbi:MAG: sensor histidine kinase [Gammaproteobacteria bacterium]|nr:sensor histidine kinase [Gammaproteobacteria bacterium]MBU2154973.1 sensor histidine kinase [Gammaproteobacteria bacterium]MBU2254088.1 sensor histidine kinase [Gammaproteobacteria bacterium]MBU2294390.1 sensor histidine kinase [Gammaproteobacteria bacterium]
MKHVVKDCWVLKPWFGILLLTTALLAVFIPLATAAESPLHITTAQLLSIPDQDFSPPPQLVNERLLPDKWATVNLPHALTRQLIPATAEYGNAKASIIETWYRLKLPASASEKQHQLYIPRWKTDGNLAIYADGQLIYMSHSGVYWNGWNIPLSISLNSTANTPSPSTILLRIQRPSDSGGGISSVWVQESSSLNWRYRLRHLLQVQLPYTSSVVFLAVGLFSFFVWCRSRHEYSYLLFFFISTASFIRTLHYYVGETELPMPEYWFSWLTINSLFWMVLVTHFFLRSLHHRPNGWLSALVTLVTLLAGALTLPMFSGLLNAYSLSPLIYCALILTGSLVAGAGAYQSWQAECKDGLLLSGWAIAGMLFGCHDWLLQNNYLSIESIYIGPYSNIGAFLIVMSIIFKRFLEANENVKKTNANLAFRLQERENELTKSHQRLREIEHRQTLSNERQRLMQDMHDGMGSSLIIALLEAEKGHLDAPSLTDVLKNCIEDLKLTIDSMEPVEADLLLLLATLRFRLTPRLESAGIRLRWDIQNVPAIDWLDPRNALHILRILQETFSNIIKHTNATEVRITTSSDATHVRVIIIDNGQGFTKEHSACFSGKGLKNQLRRAASIGAEILLHSTTAGVNVTLTLPIIATERNSKPSKCPQ